MDDILSGMIVFIIPGTLFISLVSVFFFLLSRKSKIGKPARIVGLILTLISFLLAFGLTFLLLAHPYMNYSLIAAVFSFLAFLLIYFMRPGN